MSEPSQSSQFLTLEDSAAVDGALLAQHEKFLTRLTLSSLVLLRQIAKDSGVAIEDLDPPMIIHWFEQDSKVRREQGLEAAFLKW